jgi:hypothetical protein
VGEHHERVVERVALGIRAQQLRRPIRVDSPEYVVVGKQVVETQILDRSPELSDRGRISV